MTSEPTCNVERALLGLPLLVRIIQLTPYISKSYPRFINRTGYLDKQEQCTLKYGCPYHVFIDRHTPIICVQEIEVLP